KHNIIRKPGGEPVAECRQRDRVFPPKLLPSRKIRLETDHAECDHYTNSFHPFELVEQIRPAIREFRRKRSIIGRGTVNRSRDVAINQAKAVTPVSGRRLVSKTEIVQSAVKPIARPVACEDSSSP